jgi:hypothetical protein
MRDFIIALIGLVNSASKVLVAVALLAFFIGIIRFMASADSEKIREQARNTILWGIISLFVMLSVWAIVAVLQTELGISGTSNYGKNDNASSENVKFGENNDVKSNNVNFGETKDLDSKDPFSNSSVNFSGTPVNSVNTKFGSQLR